LHVGCTVRADDGTSQEQVLAWLEDGSGLGLAYKKNTGDARESPAVRVAELLLGMGAQVRGAGPLVTQPPFALRARLPAGPFRPERRNA
jgi:hypothetical protein